MLPVRHVMLIPMCACHVALSPACHVILHILDPRFFCKCHPMPYDVASIVYLYLSPIN